MKVLLELRPALEGHSGIPQETRLLFRGLALLKGVAVEGLLQSSSRRLARGLPPDDAVLAQWPQDKRINRLSRVIVSLQPGKGRGIVARVADMFMLGVASALMIMGAAFGRRQSLTRFDPLRFEDFVWRALFARTLPSEDFAAVTTARYRVARLPWGAAHACGLLTRRFGVAVYPRLETRGYDLMIAETPYPGRVSADTRLVVRYHDAFPLLMPHTITDRSRHQASHYQALRRNVRDGAWFACVSEASRKDLISVFPEVEPRTTTIPNMVSHRYFAEDSSPGQVPKVLRTRANQRVKSVMKKRGFADPSRDSFKHDDPPQYLLMVSTLEPRKNHLGLLAAWEQLRSSVNPRLQLVLVGMLGWDHKSIMNKLLPWISQGLVHILDDVPAAELRLLYRHAQVTVCPSFGEGFGFSGVEAMRCAGVVAASDLPVHREIYADAAVYFDPYSSGSIVSALMKLMGPGSASEELRRTLVEKGNTVSARYMPEAVLPSWQAFLDSFNS